VWYCWKNKLDFFEVADVYSPGIALGHIFGRIGCTAAGCCFGSPAPANALFSITYPLTKYSIAPHGIPLYPVQLFESFGELAIFLLLFFFRKHKKFNGEIFLFYIILYPILRSILELYRGDDIRGFVVDHVLSTSQFISILWVIVAIVLWTGVLRKKSV
jgi:phosphatidylglycerol:prolipoprotein diacylglycerol transferase